MYSKMSILKVKLPPHCQIKKRAGGKYHDIYFMPHPATRPHDWPASIKIGRIPGDMVDKIVERADDYYNEYEHHRSGVKIPSARAIKTGSIPDVIKKYRQSYLYNDLTERTQKDYYGYLRQIEDWSEKNKHPHISKLTIPAVVKYLNTFEDTPVKQKRMKNILSTLCTVAMMEGYIPSNPVTSGIKLRKRVKPKRDVVLWSEDDVDAFVDACDERKLHSLGSIALTMIETAQRKGDVISMRTGVDYQDGKLAYVQSKTGKTVWMNATQKLRNRLDRYKSNDFYMFVNENTGKKWLDMTATHKARDILNAIGKPDHILMELRHSRVNYLYELGLDDATIIAMTGHEKPDTMRRHYREKINQELANKGIARIDKFRELQTNSKS